MPHHDPATEHCIELCRSCQELCLHTVAYCLDQGGEHAKPRHVRLLLDCADICQTAADFMIRGSDLHPLSCGTCAEVCGRCAVECAHFEGDATMRACADACAQCAASCNEMARLPVAP